MQRFVILFNVHQDSFKLVLMRVGTMEYATGHNYDARGRDRGLLEMLWQ